MAHVVRHRPLPPLVHELLDQTDAAPVGRHLRVKVAQVIGQLARPGGTRARGREQGGDTLLVVRSPAHELERLDSRALVRDCSGKRGHGTGGDPAHVRVVTSGRDQEHELAVSKHRSDDGYVGEVAAPRPRVIGDQNVPLVESPVLGPMLQLPSDRLAHRA